MLVEQLLEQHREEVGRGGAKVDDAARLVPARRGFGRLDGVVVRVVLERWSFDICVGS